MEKSFTYGRRIKPLGEENGVVCRGGAEWIMDKLDYTIADYTTEMGKEFYHFIREIQPDTMATIIKIEPIPSEARANL